MSGGGDRPAWIYILAGGQSRRFGQDKARALVEGSPLLLHVARAAEPLGGEMRVVAAQEGEYQDLGLETVADQRAGHGR